MASIIPKYCHVPTRFAFNVWIELSRHLLGTRANFDARYAVNWSQSHGAGLKPYPLLFLSTNFWIWWRDNDVKSFLNVPPIRLRWDFRNVGSSSDRVCWVWLIWCRVWVEFRLSSVRFGSVSVTIFGFWFSCQPTFKFDGETTTWSHFQMFHPSDSGETFYQRGAPGIKRSRCSTLKSEKKIQNITKTMYYLLCIFTAITQITYLIIIFTLNKTAENGTSFEFSFLKKSFEKDRLCDGHFLNIRKYKHIFKWTLKIVNSSFLN